ncbi:MAG TPA: hypothetical protein VGD62_09270, partial [Acidobacteriaceae bacterium]
MSTSEYIKRGESAGQEFAAVQPPDHPGGPVTRRAAHNSPAMASAALMMLIDMGVTLGAIGIAILLHFVLIARLPFLSDMAINVTPHRSDGWYLLGFLMVLLFVLRRYGLYNGVPDRSAAHEQRLISQACLTAGLLLCGWLYMAHNYELSRVLVVVLVGTTAVALGIRRAVWRKVRFAQYAKGVETRNVVILGTNHLSSAMGQQIEDDYHLGYQLCGFLSAPGCEDVGEVDSQRVLGRLDRLREL